MTLHDVAGHRKGLVRGQQKEKRCGLRKALLGLVLVDCLQTGFFVLVLHFGFRHCSSLSFSSFSFSSSEAVVCSTATRGGLLSFGSCFPFYLCAQPGRCDGSSTDGGIDREGVCYVYREWNLLSGYFQEQIERPCMISGIKEGCFMSETTFRSQIFIEAFTFPRNNFQSLGRLRFNICSKNFFIFQTGILIFIVL